MKLGISLVGISHLIGNQRWPISRSYLDCKENYTNVFKQSMSKVMEVTAYTTTYSSSESQNILEFYKPKKHLFLDFVSSHQILTFIKSLELLEDEQLDYLLITRFDIHFDLLSLKSLKFDLTKFNFLCKEKDHWDNYKFVNDCFYFLPFNLLKELKNASIDLYNNPPRPGLMDMHGLYTPLAKIIGEGKIHFMTDEHHLSSGNSIYTLKRRNQ